eukprot:scaffold58031_cov60-Phaeocystis_antarctica.AAC.2
MPPKAESMHETSERISPCAEAWPSGCAAEGICEVAVPHASVTRARYWAPLRCRPRKTRKSSPVKMVFIWDSSWNVVGSTACGARG